MLSIKEAYAAMVTRVKGITVGKLSRISGKRASRSGGRGAASSAVSPAARGDGVAFSSDARAVGRADEAVSQAPDVRADLVGPIREAVASGRYRVSSLEVADKILRQVLLDRKSSV